ncbi:MAG: biopolymer transporter ExbD [bacterium]|nr:MAG: biopolymer transporter ExbD [bacterium]
MFHNFLKKKTQGNYEINMTPLIDVSLVLVVMLLLLTPLAFESSIAVRKAVSSAKKSENQEKEERIEIHIIAEDSVLVNRTLVARSELSEVLEPILVDKVQRRVVIDCADNVSHGAFVSVLDQAKLCGAAEIAVLGR